VEEKVPIVSFHWGHPERAIIGVTCAATTEFRRAVPQDTAEASLAMMLSASAIIRSITTAAGSMEWMSPTPSPAGIGGKHESAINTGCVVRLDSVTGELGDLSREIGEQFTAIEHSARHYHRALISTVNSSPTRRARPASVLRQVRSGCWAASPTRHTSPGIR
jgi:hypothetical protein